MAKILIVEDDPGLLDTLGYNLACQDYEVCTACDCTQALNATRQEHPDLIVLGLNGQDANGMSLCRALRQETIVPILALTSEREDGPLPLAGADEYVAKPFSMREFLARTKSLLHRAMLIRQQLVPEEEQTGSGRIQAGDLIIDELRREVKRDGNPLRLKPKEYELLVFLARNQGIALERDQILERVWGQECDVGSRTVDVHVRWLREKIEADPADPNRIVTVRGVGYRFDG
jgi:DNA-binding response OmpR family regulator